MPPYVILTNISGMIPGTFLSQALDDTGDGTQNSAVWCQIAKDVQDVIDGEVGKRYALPLPYPYPAVVLKAAKILAAEQCYTRRGKVGDANPFSKQADGVRAELAAIAAGTQPLDPALNRAKPSVTVIAAKAGTTSAAGKTSV